MNKLVKLIAALAMASVAQGVSAQPPAGSGADLPPPARQRAEQRIEQIIARLELTEQQQSEWQNQLTTILTLTKTETSRVDAAESLVHLQTAVARLQKMVGLRLLNPEFCMEVRGFGQIRSFESTQFRPNQKVLVYCEVENYETLKSQSNDGVRYSTELLGSYVIVDSLGKAVQQGDFPAIQDQATTKRRDFYMYFPIQFKDLDAGQYQMEILVEDLNSKQSAWTKPALSFEIK